VSPKDAPISQWGEIQTDDAVRVRWPSPGSLGYYVFGPLRPLICLPVPARSSAVASNTSKTARASVRAGQAQGGALSVLGEFKYLIPLADGKFAYVRNLTNGKTNRLRTNSDQFAEEIRILSAAGHGTKIRAEIATLAATNPTHGWDATEQRLVDAGVFGA
jgi:hypothetical protein